MIEQVAWTIRHRSGTKTGRRGDPANVGKPSPNATVTRKGGRFDAAHRAPCAWYLNDDASIAYARKAPNGGRLSQPVLFVNGDFDQTNTIIGNRQGEPMRAACQDLTVTSLPAAHWLPLERKAELVQAMRTWLRSKKL